MSNTSGFHKPVKIILFLSVFSSVFILIFINYNPRLFQVITLENLKRAQGHRDDSGKYAIKTRGCHIPAMQVLNKLIKTFINKLDVQPCPDTNFSIVLQNGSHIWYNNDARIKEHYKIPKNGTIKCCYSSFFRPNKIENIYSNNIDERIEYRKCVDFKDVTAVNKEDEFFKITCKFNDKVIKEEFFIFAPFKTNDHVKNRKPAKTPYNVLIIGIDNVSRLNFHRMMPKTSAFVKNRGAVEFMGYNKVGDNSFPNIVPLLMGYTADEIKKICQPERWTTYDDCPFLWHWFKEAGYHTAFGEDSARLGTFNYLAKGFRKTPTDYYLHPFIGEAERRAGKAISGNVVLCVNERYKYQIVLDYIQALTKTLNDHRLFGFFWETTVSHDYFNYPMLLDDSYLQLLKKLEESKYLDKTILFLISDHGIRWGYFRNTYQGYLEERLPLVLILTPKSFRENYAEAYNNLLYNSRQLTTPFDMHETWLDLIDFELLRNKTVSNKNIDKNARGISLFVKIPDNRTCKSAGIADHWCTCHERVPMLTNSNETLLAAHHLLLHLNNLLKDYPQCVNIVLDKILEAERVVTDLDKKAWEQWKEYSVMIQVKPSGGVFEATLRDDGKKWSVIGTVSRLNMYGKQSHCVEGKQIKLYCYCAKQ